MFLPGNLQVLVQKKHFEIHPFSQCAPEYVLVLVGFLFVVTGTEIDPEVCLQVFVEHKY